MSRPTVAQKAYSIREAAELKSVSQDFIRAAMRRAEGNVLAATNIGSAANPRYRINASALEDWWNAMADA